MWALQRNSVLFRVRETMKPRSKIKALLHRDEGSTVEMSLLSRIDTVNELDYYKNGGILQHVIRTILKTEPA